MSAAPYYCCRGTGRIDPDVHPLCSTAIGRRDTRSSAMLAAHARLQQYVLRGIAFDVNGDLLPEHGQPYVDCESGRVRV